MALLLAADGATFSGLVEKIDSQARASFSVTLDRGSDRKVENGSKVFASEKDATAWIEHEAHVRGFRDYLLSLQYPPKRHRCIVDRGYDRVAPTMEAVTAFSARFRNRD